MSGNDSPNDAPAPHQKSRRTQPARTYQHTHAVHVARGGAAPPPPPPRGDVRPRSMCAGRGAGGTGGRGSCRRRPPVPRPSRDLLSSRPLTTQSRRVSAYLGISRHISAYLRAERVPVALGHRVELPARARRDHLVDPRPRRRQVKEFAEIHKEFAEIHKEFAEIISSIHGHAGARSRWQILDAWARE